MNRAKTILLVDDDQDDRDLFFEAAREIDNSIICLSAENGEKALQMLNTLDPLPDFIFLDLNMPRVDGRECLAEIKKTPRLAQIPVVIYTTSSSPKDIQDTRRLGASFFSTKPSSYRELCRILADIITGEAVYSPVS